MHAVVDVQMVTVTHFVHVCCMNNVSTSYRHYLERTLLAVSLCHWYSNHCAVLCIGFSIASLNESKLLLIVN